MILTVSLAGSCQASYPEPEPVQCRQPFPQYWPFGSHYGKIGRGKAELGNTPVGVITFEIKSELGPGVNVSSELRGSVD